MAMESEMIRNGGGLIDVTLCDGFLYCASVFSKSIGKATLSFPYVLDPAFGALYHVWFPAANDPQTGNDPQIEPQMISTANDPRCGPQMIPAENEEWHGVCSSGRGFIFF